MGIAAVQCELGRYDESIKLFNDTINYINNNLNKDNRKNYQADVYYAQSLPLSEKGEYLDALKQCHHALQILINHDFYDSLVPRCFEMIGNIYGSLGGTEKTKGNTNG